MSRAKIPKLFGKSCQRKYRQWPKTSFRLVFLTWITVFTVVNQGSRISLSRIETLLSILGGNFNNLIMYLSVSVCSTVIFQLESKGANSELGRHLGKNESEMLDQAELVHNLLVHSCMDIVLKLFFANKPPVNVYKGLFGC